MSITQNSEWTLDNNGSYLVTDSVSPLLNSERPILVIYIQYIIYIPQTATSVVPYTFNLFSLNNHYGTVHEMMIMSQLQNITNTYHKSKAVFYDNVSKSSVASEKPLKVSLPDTIAQSSHVDACPHHPEIKIL